MRRPIALERAILDLTQEFAYELEKRHLGVRASALEASPRRSTPGWQPSSPTWAR